MTANQVNAKTKTKNKAKAKNDKKHSIQSQQDFPTLKQ